MWKQFINNTIGGSSTGEITLYFDARDRIMEQSRHFSGLSDRSLRSAERSDQESLFSVIFEVVKRTLGIETYPEQILAALALSDGKLIEMQTGEGKTLAAVFPAIQFALHGRGCHVLTFNDYLALRDANWTEPVYRFFNLSLGVIQKDSSWEERKIAYDCDVTYATAEEAGFDYLRTQLCTSLKTRTQRELSFVIVDEADSILIDEARNPLVLAGPERGGHIDRNEVDALVKQLDRTCIEIDDNERNVLLTESGISTIETFFGCGPLHQPENRTLLTSINQTLHAHYLLKKDVDYIVSNNVVHLVDEFTGRVHPRKRWPDGLQSAIEIKEKVPAKPESRVLATSSLQHFIRSYNYICGMTATAREEREEFKALYGLEVVCIPTNQPNQRIDHASIVYAEKGAKTAAVVNEIQLENSKGRPVLVGTATVEESNFLAKKLRELDLDCAVLNAANDEQEAGLIANAGLPQAITISTNMAGRGTDIKLGGSNELLRQTVIESGGLHVIGTNHFESSRIDRQLRGRAGRQGEPGTTRFIVCLEDTLLSRFGISEYLVGVKMPQDLVGSISDPRAGSAINRLQRVVAGQNGEIRATLWKYSQLLEDQRKFMSSWRAKILKGNESIFELCNNAAALREKYPKELENTESRLFLHHIDNVWADHLSVAADLRESANLTIKISDIGSFDPYLGFREKLHATFLDFQNEVRTRVIRDLNSEEFHNDDQGLDKPTNTWAYLVNDQFFDLERSAMHRYANSGESTMVILVAWPFMLLWGLWRTAIKLFSK